MCTYGVPLKGLLRALVSPLWRCQALRSVVRPRLSDDSAVYTGQVTTHPLICVRLPERFGAKVLQ